jgi:hypothetical protein
VFLHHCVVYALTCQPEPLDVSSLTIHTTGDYMNDQFQVKLNIFMFNLFFKYAYVLKYEFEIVVWTTVNSLYFDGKRKTDMYNTLFKM